jgi:siderophore synthetase component
MEDTLNSVGTIITPIWTYGFELWGCASKSNIAVIQRCQSKILTATLNAPRYVNNVMIHKDLGIPTVKEVIHDRSIKHRTILESYLNALLQPRT